MTLYVLMMDDVYGPENDENCQVRRLRLIGPFAKAQEQAAWIESMVDYEKDQFFRPVDLESHHAFCYEIDIYSPEGFEG